MQTVPKLASYAIAATIAITAVEAFADDRKWRLDWIVPAASQDDAEFWMKELPTISDASDLSDLILWSYYHKKNISWDEGYTTDLLDPSLLVRIMYANNWVISPLIVKKFSHLLVQNIYKIDEMFYLVEGVNSDSLVEYIPVQLCSTDSVCK